jgi:hypothetical protein
MLSLSDTDPLLTKLIHQVHQVICIADNAVEPPHNNGITFLVVQHFTLLRAFVSASEQTLFLFYCADNGRRENNDGVGKATCEATGIIPLGHF